MRIVGTICGQDSPCAIEVTGGRIQSIEPADEDAAGRMLCPALLDLQVNGFAGHDLNAAEPSPEEVAAVAGAVHSSGVGMHCPTVVTAPSDRMAAALRAIARACEDEAVAASVPAIHLEGPYISPEEGPRGAHPLEQVREPDWEEFCRLQDAAGGRIGIVTLAPERPGGLAFIERLAARGVVPAIGHTAATPQQIGDAVRAGARLATHVGNGAHAMLPRHPNYVWEQLAQDRLWASFIPDGHHLPPSVLKCMIRAKGVERTILVSDAVRLAGMPPGEYGEGGRAVEVTEDGAVRLKGTPFLAGAALDLVQGVGNAVRFAGVSLEDALGMATLNPARLLGIDDRVGGLAVGKEASLTVFQWDADACRLHVLETIVRGKAVCRRHP